MLKWLVEELALPVPAYEAHGFFFFPRSFSHPCQADDLCVVPHSFGVIFGEYPDIWTE